MRRFIVFVLAAVLFSSAALAQVSSKDFNDRYQLLVSKLGPSGVGVETLINRWEAAYPDDIEMLIAKFSFYFSKSQSSSVVVKDQDKYLGEKPVFSLKDSTGKAVNYFTENFYDDELFGQAQKALEKAIQLAPHRLDFRFMKTAAYVGYEKESPDMALSDLRSLIIYNETQHPSWVYAADGKVDEEFFVAAVQEYCYAFFKCATPGSYEAFRELSQTMLTYRPNDVLFLDNMGSYYLVVKKDNKQALKYYNKVLKIKPDDLTAIKNLVLMARSSGNVKLEKKYLPMLVKYTDSEAERMSAKARLEKL